MKINKCRSCDSNNLEEFINLGESSWCNELYENIEQYNNRKKYPLNLVFCTKCNLVQLDYTVPTEKMFLNHNYVSGTTKTLREHFYNLALENKIQFNLQPNDFIVDIGGNDGTQLLQYKKLGLTNVLNI